MTSFIKSILRARLPDTKIKDEKKMKFSLVTLGLIDLFTDSDAIFEKSIPQCIMGYPGYMCIRREVNKL